MSQSSGSAWAALHSNHFSTGLLYATDILNHSRVYSQTVLATIGCHAGLNVPEPAAPSPLPDLDLAQALLGQGGVYIGPSAYAYASPFGLSYSEALALELTHQLLVTQTQEIGPALVRAKQVYYASHGWFDYTDEKVLLPVTLYGLPMLRVATPDIFQHAPAIQSPAAARPAVAKLDGLTVVTHTLGGLTFTQHVTDDGVYYDYRGQIIAQDSLPVQPSLQMPLTTTLDGQTAHGVLLRTATYTEMSPFDPIVAQSWAIGEERSTARSEPPATLVGRDRDLPYALGRFDGLTDTVASLNLVLGIYDGKRQAEMLFNSLTLTVLYGDSFDQAAPAILSTLGHLSDGVVFFRVSASDDEAIVQVSVTYDDGQSHWQSIELASSDSEVWTGETTNVMTRFYVQAVDTNGNVTVGSWRTPAKYFIYLPLVIRSGD